MSNVFESIDAEIGEIVDGFNLDEKPEAPQYSSLAQTIRAVANKSCGDGDLKGYVLHINELDCSNFVAHWPEALFLRPDLKVELVATGADGQKIIFTHRKGVEAVVEQAPVPAVEAPAVAVESEAPALVIPKLPIQRDLKPELNPLQSGIADVISKALGA